MKFSVVLLTLLAMSGILCRRHLRARREGEEGDKKRVDEVEPDE